MQLTYKSLRVGMLSLGLCTLAACLTGCNGGSSPDGSPVGPTPIGTSPQTQGFNVTVLVTGPQSIFEANTVLTDSNLSKPWDLAVGDGPIWVANAHTTVATVYDANGVTRNEAIKIPGSRGGSHVTGLVQTTGNTVFPISANGASGQADFIFSTSSGTLAAWSAGSGFATQAVTVYTDPAGAEYTGLALLTSGSSPFLYAADFQNGRIDTFDSGFNKISPRGNFRDPTLPAGYKPFNIQTLGDRLAVVYAKPRAANGALTIVEGPGIGVGSLSDNTLFFTTGTVRTVESAFGHIQPAPVP